ncbi:uncharacterized protein LOC119161665 isoform X2 [Rhipicephalus microplus]|uniref:uncharacterized protein LOC119161665 isoform X2 n=1 Tax=Rhipicephalus microplus TaxID=6941 RepID=UPI003F6BFCE4
MAPRGSRKKKKKTRICSRHFGNNAKSESQANPAYLSTLFPDVYKKRRVSGERHERWAKRSRSAAKNLTSPHPPEESSPVDVLSNASEADCSPDANAQSKALERGSLLLTEVEVDAQQFTLTKRRQILCAARVLCSSCCLQPMEPMGPHKSLTLLKQTRSPILKRHGQGGAASSDKSP